MKEYYSSKYANKICKQNMQKIINNTSFKNNFKILIFISQFKNMFKAIKTGSYRIHDSVDKLLHVCTVRTNCV